MIEVNNLEKKYENKVIFQITNLKFEPGIYCLYGESGSGKTTLLNILAQLETEYEGEVKIFGKKYKPLSEELLKLYRKEIAYISQKPLLIEDQTVTENLAVSEKPYNEIIEVLDSLNMKDKATSRVSKLSGGEQQRVCLALALLKDANIIFADEPTGSLDQKNAKIIIDKFFELSELGKLIIIVSHDLGIIERITNKIPLEQFKEAKWLEGLL
ncbi:MAG: ATP-binding cassette domain-containing protein [Mycoplasmatales bacterium]